MRPIPAPKPADELPAAAWLARGTARFLADLGYRSVAEFKLGNGRRADLFALNERGHAVLVEIKTSEADFRADAKWPDYLPYCDAFYFAVPAAFPRAILPEDHGLIVADAYHAEILRPAPAQALNATRRRHLFLRFGLVAAARLQAFEDPRL